MIVDAHFHLFNEFYQYRYPGLVKDIDRVVARLFGSDLPVHHPLERLYRWEVVFEHFFRLSGDDQAKIFGGNAERVLRELSP